MPHLGHDHAGSLKRTSAPPTEPLLQPSEGSLVLLPAGYDTRRKERHLSLPGNESATGVNPVRRTVLAQAEFAGG